MRLTAFAAALAAVAAGVRDSFTYLDNGVIRVGVDATRGGSIGYLSQSGSTYNVLNIHDMGREIQLSFYAGPNAYNPGGKCNYSPWTPWPWNPIGAGDVAGNAGTILNVTNNGTNARVTSIPLQWACDNVPCECTFDQDITLEPGATWLNGRATLSNARSDHTDYGAHGQELPATYTIGDLHNLVAYTGTTPWANAPVSNISTPAGPPWVPGVITVTENWAAFLNDDMWGMGVYSPGYSAMNTGFHGTPGGGPTDDSTGYIAPYGVADLTWNVTFSFDYAIVLGNLATIRSFAYQAHAAGRAARQSVFADFSVTATRHTWIPVAGTGKRVQLVEHGDEALSVAVVPLADKLASGNCGWQSASVVGPVQAWEAAEVPALRLRAKYEESLRGVTTARFCALPAGINPFEAPTAEGAWRPGQPLQAAFAASAVRYAATAFDGAACVEFTVAADGAWHEYNIPLAGEAAGYAGTFIQAKLDLAAANDWQGVDCSVDAPAAVHIAWLKPVARV